MAVILETRRTY